MISSKAFSILLILFSWQYFPLLCQTDVECRYGTDPNCGFQCNCEYGECDKKTGECASGCKEGMPPEYPWRGPGCRIGNVAYNKFAEQSVTDASYAANRSVDGNTNPIIDKGSCSRTKQGESSEYAWWRVNLEDTFVVERVIIHNRDKSFQRTANFTLKVGKTLSDLQVCYHYGDVMVDGATLTLKCEPKRKGMWFVFKREGGKDPFILNFCEIIVIGYKPVECSSKCLGDCDDLRGCTKCQAGSKLPDCKQDCPNGYYGENCRYSCGRCRDSPFCDITSGACGNGCVSGYAEPTCHTLVGSGTNADGTPGEGKGNVTNTNKTPSDGKGAVVGGVICVLIIVAAVGIVFFVKRKKDKKPTGTSEETEPLSKSGSKQSKISKSGSKLSIRRVSKE